MILLINSIDFLKSSNFVLYKNINYLNDCIIIYKDGTSKDVPENTCRNCATKINAKNPENIFIIILEQVLG